jgi:hypothetical protein
MIELRSTKYAGHCEINKSQLCAVDTWGRCYDHKFLRFLLIFGEKIKRYVCILKKQCYYHIFAKISRSLIFKIAIFFRQIFRQKYF